MKALGSTSSCSDSQRDGIVAISDFIGLEVSTSETETVGGFCFVCSSWIVLSVFVTTNLSPTFERGKDVFVLSL